MLIVSPVIPGVTAILFYDKNAFKKLTDCILVKLSTHYTSGHKRTGLVISKRVEGAALNDLHSCFVLFTLGIC